ncbi:LamG domain-containing protein [Kitasatospora sp. NPDC096147]|uniref:LamG domain-containing protein n=1 Tax=Kitasatospora sp. NPDC096147 TaxID=3364093 RepID=UPI003825377B
MTDGTERPDVAPTPGQHPSQTPNEAAPAGAFPPVQPGQIPGQAAYGYPHPQSGYPAPGGYPAQGGYPSQDGYGYPHPQAQFQQFQQQPPNASPSWEQLADQEEQRVRRRKRTITAVVVAVAVALGVGAGYAVINKTDDEKTPTVAATSPTADGSSTAKPSGSATPGQGGSVTVPGDPNTLADLSGQANLAIGPDAEVSRVPDGHVLRLRSNNNSHAESATKVVDVNGSFTIAAWVYNEAPEGQRTAISQGDGASFSFDLGRNATQDGKKFWEFRVQTADGGADSTIVSVASENINTVGEWALLTGVYDASTKTVALFVNGQPASKSASAQVPGIWSGPGPLQLGRSRQHKLWSGNWAGVIGSTKIWNLALSADQIASLKTNGVKEKPTASWLVG